LSPCDHVSTPPYMSPATCLLLLTLLCSTQKKTYFALRAAEDGGRTQHEGQQRERGVKLVNILCENKLNSEYIHHTQLLVPLPIDRFPTNIHIYYHTGFLGMYSGLVWLRSNPPQSMLIGRDYTIDLSSSKQVPVWMYACNMYVFFSNTTSRVFSLRRRGPKTRRIQSGTHNHRQSG
jgi:hypothetical protein